jgi:hypothetical protein
MNSKLVLLVASIFLCTGCTPTYSGLPFEFQVVDADTGEPLEGVIANAVWVTEDRRGHETGAIVATEAVSDESGMVRMPGWANVRVLRRSWDPYSIPRLDPNQPWLYMYKRDYYFFHDVPTGDTGYLSHPFWTGDSVRTPNWGGRKLKLRKFAGSTDRYAFQLDLVPRYIFTNCLWTTAPQMAASLINETRRLKALKQGAGLPELRDLDRYSDGRDCGSIDVVRQYLSN